jgi:hypothetical protein
VRNILAGLSACVIAGAVVAAMQLPASRALDPPVIPVGLDAYRMWDRWPYQRIGARAYMRSTYDRQGGNHMAYSLSCSPAWASSGSTPLSQRTR